MALVWEETKLVRDAQGCWCVDCGHLLADETDTAWHWTKSKAMHQRGTGHKVINVRLSTGPDGGHE